MSGSLFQSRAGGLQDSLFGVLYTIMKEDEEDDFPLRTFWLQLLSIVLDYVQLLLFVVNPDYPWSVPFKIPFLHYLQNVNVSIVFTAQPVQFFQAFFFLFSASIIGCCGLIVVVARFFAQGSFPFVWPIAVLKVYGNVVLDTFYISSISSFFSALDCNVFGPRDIRKKDGTKIHLKRFYSTTYPDQNCFQSVNLAMFTLSIPLAVVAIILSGFKTLTGAKFDLTNQLLTATVHTKLDLRLWIIKTAITGVAIFLAFQNSLKAYFVIISYAYAYYILLRRVPYMTRKMNQLYGGLYATVVWTCICLIPMLVSKQVNRRIATLAFVLGFPFILYLGWFSVAWRLNYPIRVAAMFRQAMEAGEDCSATKHKFWDDHEVEITARIALARHPKTKEIMAWSAALSETILRAGLEQFPQSAYLHIMLANFYYSVRRDNKSGTECIEKARALPTTFEEKFMIFVRERENKQRGHDGSTAADLLSFVEFKRSYRLCVQNYRQAITSVRRFWFMLLGTKISYRKLLGFFKSIEAAEMKADENFLAARIRFPKSVKLLRLYANYMENVKKDPHHSRRLMEEAERLEDVQAEEHREALLAASMNVEGKSAVDLESLLMGEGDEAVVVINTEGVITFANRSLARMFGYRRGELEGENINLLMPEPFSKSHNQYLRRYMTTGHARILNTAREVVALHKERYVFPILLFVSKISLAANMDVGSGVHFVGIIRKMRETDASSTLYVTAQGQMLCCSKSFTRMLGWEMNDIIGTNIHRMAKNPDIMKAEFQHSLDIAKRKAAGFSDIGETAYTMARIPESQLNADPTDNGDGNGTSQQHGGVLNTFEVELRNKYTGQGVKSEIQVFDAGTAEHIILILRVKQQDPNLGIMAVSEDGTIRFASASTERILGYKSGSLNTGSALLGSLLPFPYTLLHRRYVEDLVAQKKARKPMTTSAVSCSSGRTVFLRDQASNLVPVRLKVNVVEKDGQMLFGSTINVVKEKDPWTMIPPEDDQLVQGARMRIVYDVQVGTIILSDLPTRASGTVGLFGLCREDLVGQPLTETLDMFAEALQTSRLVSSDIDENSVSRSLLSALNVQADETAVYSYRAQVRGGSWPRDTYVPAALVINPEEIEYICLERMMEAGYDVPRGLGRFLEASRAQAQAASDPFGPAPAAPAQTSLKPFMVIDLFAFERLQGCFEITHTGQFTKIDRCTAILLSIDQDKARLFNILQLLASPAAAASNKGIRQLGIRPGKMLGDRVDVDLRSLDGGRFVARILMVKRTEDGEVLQGIMQQMTPCTETSAYTRFNDLLAHGVTIGYDPEVRARMNAGFPVGLDAAARQPPRISDRDTDSMAPGQRRPRPSAGPSSGAASVSIRGGRPSLDNLPSKSVVQRTATHGRVRTSPGTHEAGIERQATTGRHLASGPGALEDSGRKSPPPVVPGRPTRTLGMLRLGTKSVMQREDASLAVAALGGVAVNQRALASVDDASDFAGSPTGDVPSRPRPRTLDHGIQLNAPVRASSGIPPVREPAAHTEERPGRAPVGRFNSFGTLGRAVKAGSKIAQMVQHVQHGIEGIIRGAPIFKKESGALPHESPQGHHVGIDTVSRTLNAVHAAGAKMTGRIPSRASSSKALEAGARPGTLGLAASGGRPAGGRRPKMGLDTLSRTLNAMGVAGAVGGGSSGHKFQRPPLAGSSSLSRQQFGKGPFMRASRVYPGRDVLSPMNSLAGSFSSHGGRTELTQIGSRSGAEPLLADRSVWGGAVNADPSVRGGTVNADRSVRGGTVNVDRSVRGGTVNAQGLSFFNTLDSNAADDRSSGGGSNRAPPGRFNRRGIFRDVSKGRATGTAGLGLEPHAARLVRPAQLGLGLLSLESGPDLVTDGPQGRPGVTSGAGGARAGTFDGQRPSEQPQEIDDYIQTTVDEKHTMDLGRLQRARTMTMLLRNKGVRKSSQMLALVVKLASIIFIIGHLAVFLVYQIYLSDLKDAVRTVAQSGAAMHSLQETVIATRELQYWVAPDAPTLLSADAPLVDLSSVDSTKARLQEEATDFEAFMFDILDFTVSHTKMAKRAYASLTVDPIPVLFSYDGTNPVSPVYNRMASLWESARALSLNAMVAAGSVQDNGTTVYPELLGAASFVEGNGLSTVYLQLHDLLDGLMIPEIVKSVGTVVGWFNIILVLEGTILTPFIGLAIYKTGGEVVKLRASFFSICLLVPKYVLLPLATRDLKIDHDEDEEDVANSNAIAFDLEGIKQEDLAKLDEEAREYKMSHLAGFSAAARVQHQASSRQLNTAGSTEVYKLSFPYMLFSLILLIFAYVSTTLFYECTSNLGVLKEANKLYQLSARTRGFSQEMALSATNDLKYSAFRGKLNQTLVEFEQTFDALVFGGTSRLPRATRTDIKGLFFDRGCVRAKSSPPCPTSGPLVDATSRGLSAAKDAFSERVHDLLLEPPGRLNITSTLYLEMWELGTYDVTDGCAALCDMIAQNANLKLTIVEIYHIVMLVFIAITLILSCWTLLPLIRKTNDEAKRVADLLAELPAILKMEDVVRMTVVRTEPPPKKKKEKRPPIFTIRGLLHYFIEHHEARLASLVKETRPSVRGRPSRTKKAVKF